MDSKGKEKDFCMCVNKDRLPDFFIVGFFYDLNIDESNQTATVFESTSMDSPYTMNMDIFNLSFKRSDELKPSSKRRIIGHPYLKMDDE